MSKTLKSLNQIKTTIGADLLVYILTFFVIRWWREDLFEDLFEGLFHVFVILTIFSFVIIHEYFHCFKALQLGVPVVGIRIGFFGGAAHIQMANDPSQEFWVAIWGPISNVIFSLILGPILWVWGAGFGINEVHSPLHSLVVIAFFSNILMLIFNLLPILPMDGGRILRSTLSFKFDRQKVTFWCLIISHILTLAVASIFFSIGYYVSCVIMVLIGVMSLGEWFEWRAEKYRREMDRMAALRIRAEAAGYTELVKFIDQRA